MTNNPPAELDQAEQQELLRLARTTIEHHLKTGKRPDYASDNPKLSRESGAFVTLHIRNMLRGCIGYVESDKPLFETVMDAAISASQSDPRFPPVTLDELESLHIEISVLTPPQIVDDIAEIQVGRDGLIITSGPYRGLLLPQVASEYGWDRETFLDHTCQKAGLPAKSWQKDATIERFSAQVFGEDK